MFGKASIIDIVAQEVEKFTQAERFLVSFLVYNVGKAFESSKIVSLDTIPVFTYKVV